MKTAEHWPDKKRIPPRQKPGRVLKSKAQFLSEVERF